MYLTPVVIVVVVMASVRMLPDVMMYMSEVLGSFLSFSSGLCFGVGAVLVVEVVGLFLLTKRITSNDTSPVENSTAEGKGDACLEPKQNHRVQHPNIMRKGRFASYVWIVAESRWDVTAALHKFPPQDYGTGESKGRVFSALTCTQHRGGCMAGLVKYYAEVKDGVLTFSWNDQTQKQQIMQIELEDCSCRIVEECLGQKSVWWRKAPLEISHPSRCLYQGETRLFMFCMHGADKEQWFMSLSRNMEHGDSIKVIQHLYKRFSKRCRRKTQLRYQASLNVRSKLVRLEGKASPAERNTWFSAWRRGGNQMRPVADASEPSPSGRSRPVELAEEIEQLWNGEKSRTIFTEELARRQQRSQWRRDRRNLRKGALNTSPPSVAMQQETGVRSVPTTPSTSLDFAEGSGVEQSDGNPLVLEKPSRESEITAAEGPSASDATKDMPSQTDAGEASSARIADGVYGLNMFLGRWAFDLARNPDFEERFRAMILKRLRGLRRPSYVMPLSLCEMDLGSNFPEIRSVRSLPPQGTVICPELLVDISYSGGLELTVETFVDLREGSVWGTLDRALSSVQGSQNNLKQSEGMDMLDDMADMPEDASEVGTGIGDPEQEERSNTTRDKQPNGFSVRKYAATKAKQLAERMAESISKIPLRLSIKVEKLEGTLLIWISPPPAKRLWISFLQAPTLEVSAKPILANRVMKYSAAIGRVSSWLQHRIKQSFFSNLVFPNCTDLSFPGLLGLTDTHGLRHPSLTLMKDLTQVSECESEYSDSEPRSAPPSVVSRSVSIPRSVNPSVTDPPTEVSNAPVRHRSFTELPSDERLTTIRQNRYDTTRLNSLRRRWDGQALEAEEFPTRESHGRRVIKRCVSMSDGDVSEGDSGDEDKEHEAECVMSDCVEFFDAEGSAFDSSTSTTTEEDLSANVPATNSVKTNDNKGTQEQARGTNAAQNERLTSVPCTGNEVEDPIMRQPSNRRLGSRLGDLVRNVQSVAVEEIEAVRRRRAANQGNPNNIIKVAKQRAGERKQKVKDALENRTAQFKNSSLTRMWGQRKIPDSTTQTE